MTSFSHFPSDNIDDTLNTFNSLHTRLQFTMEVNIDNRLNFLTTLIIDNQRIIFNTHCYVQRTLTTFSFFFFMEIWSYQHIRQLNSNKNLSHEKLKKAKTPVSSR